MCGVSSKKYPPRFGNGFTRGITTTPYPAYLSNMLWPRWLFISNVNLMSLIYRKCGVYKG
jgi:hypothetical protein